MYLNRRVFVMFISHEKNNVAGTHLNHLCNYLQPMF